MTVSPSHRPVVCFAACQTWICWIFDSEFMPRWSLLNPRRAEYFEAEYFQKFPPRLLRPRHAHCSPHVGPCIQLFKNSLQDFYAPGMHIVPHMLVHAYNSLKIPVHQSGTPDTLKKEIGQSTSSGQARLLFYATLARIWTYKINFWQASAVLDLSQWNSSWFCGET